VGTSTTIFVKSHFNGNNRSSGVRRAHFEVRTTGLTKWHVLCSGLQSNSNSFHYGCDGPQPQLGFISIDLTAPYYKVGHAKNINPPRI